MRNTIWAPAKMPVAGLVIVALLLTLSFVRPAASAAAEEPLVLAGAFGPDGTESSNFERAASVAVDQSSGAVYVVDQLAGTLSRFGPDGEPLDFSYSAPNVSGNVITGFNFHFEFGKTEIAIDPATHVVYVTSGDTVVALKPSGEPSEFTAGPGAGSNELGGFTELIGLAVDGNGDIYASDYDAADLGPEGEGRVEIFARSGQPITEFQTKAPANLAVAPDGSLYVGRWVGAVAKYQPSAYPVESTTEYSKEFELTQPSASLGLAVDPVSEDLYIAGGSSTYAAASGTYKVWQYNPSGVLIRSFPSAEEIEEGGAIPFSEGVAVRASTQRVYVSYFNFPDSSLGSKVEIFAPPPPAPPAVVRTTAANVTATSAELRGGIKPGGLDTSYRFEAGTASCAQIPNPCAPVPGGSGDVGSGRAPVEVSADLTGLSPGTTYHFRLVAENALGAAERERTFTTQGLGGEFHLIDGRGWEMVSPAEKHGGEIYPPSLGIAAASDSGNGITFATMGPIDAFPEGSRPPEPAQQLAWHGANGWSSEDLEPKHDFASKLMVGGSPYLKFSSDLRSALVEPQGVGLLSPEASERTPYLRENVPLPARWRPLVTGKEGYANVPPGTEFGGDVLQDPRGPVNVWAASSDLRHVVLMSSVPLAEPMEGLSNTYFYEWSEGTLAPVSLLPSGPVPVFTGNFGTTTGSVSADGRFVYWGRDDRRALYVRDMQEGETVRLDLPKGVPSPAGEPFVVFQGASSDGRHAFFTDTEQLTPDAGPGTNLYECELVKPNSTTKCILRNLTPQSGGEGAEVQGMVLGVAEDGRTVYFVANGVLDSSAQRGSCRDRSRFAKASWLCNLYVAKREGESWKTTLVARLANKDSSDWGMSPSTDQHEARAREQVAESSPNGRYLVFMSERSLTGYENADAATGKADQEVFVYDAQVGAVHCASCNPTGAQPQGMALEETGQPPAVDPRNLWLERPVAAILPDPNVAIDGLSPVSYRPRAVHDDGRVFFNGHDALVPADVNSTWDAYEYEPTGTGGCGSEPFGSAIVAADGGCVGLLSDGTSSPEAAVVDSSLSGDDVFLLTRSRLSPHDVDDSADIYDAHVCGVGWACPAAEPPPPPPCASAVTCHPFGQTGEEGAPASATVGGPGNVARHHHRKKHHHKRHKRRHHKHAHHRRHGGAK